MCVLTGKVDVSEVIHFVTVDVVGKAPALVYCQITGECFIEEALKYHPLREEVNLQDSSCSFGFIYRNSFVFVCVFYTCIFEMYNVLL